MKRKLFVTFVIGSLLFGVASFYPRMEYGCDVNEVTQYLCESGSCLAHTDYGFPLAQRTVYAGDCSEARFMPASAAANFLFYQVATFFIMAGVWPAARRMRKKG